MEYPSLVWIKAARFLGIVVFVNCMQKALIGVLVGVLVCFQKTAERLFDVICANALTRQGQDSKHMLPCWISITAH